MSDSIEYTQTEAVEEALRLFMRKTRRLHNAAYNDVMAKLPDGARESLLMAELRADTVFLTDQRDGVTRTYPAVFEDLDDGDE